MRFNMAADEIEQLHLAIEKVGDGGRGGRLFLDLQEGRHVPLGRIATSLGGLEERLGRYELAPAVAAREARELELEREQKIDRGRGRSR